MPHILLVSISILCCPRSDLLTTFTLFEWRGLEKFEEFNSSPACIDFLNNLPEVENTAKTLNRSRFRIYRHSTEAATRELDGLVTMTTFSVPGKLDQHAYWNLVRMFADTVGHFTPTNSNTLTKYGAWTKFIRIWLCVLKEHSWVEEKFGPLPQPTSYNDEPGRAVFCHVFRWSEGYDEPHEQQRRSAADPQAKESWEAMVAELMPPATAWVQESWEIREIPLCWPPDPEPEEGSSDWEFERMRRELRASLNSDADEQSQ